MSSELTADEVRRIARLARLGLTDDEIDAYRSQLGEVLQHFAELDALDLHDLKPAFHRVDVSPLRPDVPRPSQARRHELLGAAARIVDGGFAVPKVMDGE